VLLDQLGYQADGGVAAVVRREIADAQPAGIGRRWRRRIVEDRPADLGETLRPFPGADLLLDGVAMDIEQRERRDRLALPVGVVQDPVFLRPDISPVAGVAA
jgi:hypothetical protein